MSVLRDPGEIIPVEQDFFMNEYARCAMDITYFVKNYMYIVSLDHGKIKIPLYEWQERVLRNMKGDLRYLLKVARQSGKTTIAIAFILWYSLFHQDKYIAVVAHLFNASKEILRRYRESYMMLPKWLQQGVVKFGKEEIELENGTLIAAFATESPNLRGKSVNLLYLDEFALIKKTAADDFIKSVMPVVSSGLTSRVIITSTPNGYNHFYEMWMQTLPNPETGIVHSKYRAEEVKWDDIPGRDEAWKESILYGDLKGDVAAWEQEFECKFRTSSAGVFNKVPFDEFNSRPLELLYNDCYKLYEKERDPECIYIAGVDMSEGLGKDSCVINVLKYNPSEDKFYQVLNYNDNGADPYHMASVISYIHTKVFQLDTCYIENNKDFGLINILLNDDYGLNDIMAFDNKAKKYGVKTTGQSKPNWVTELLFLLNKEKLILRCLGTQYELSKFGKNGPRYEGLDGAHDDEVMSIMIMMEYVKSNEYAEYKKAGTKTLTQKEEARIGFHIDENNSTVNEFALSNLIEKHTTEHNNNKKLVKPTTETLRKRQTDFNIDDLVAAREQYENGFMNW